MAVLNKWSVIFIDGTPRLHGIFEGHPCVPNGEEGITSRLVTIEQRDIEGQPVMFAFTENTTYLLEEQNEDFVSENSNTLMDLLGEKEKEEAPMSFSIPWGFFHMKNGRTTDFVGEYEDCTKMHLNDGWYFGEEAFHGPFTTLEMAKQAAKDRR